MEFHVLKFTPRGNLLLSCGTPRPVERMPLFLRGKKVAFVFDTIGKVRDPLYLAHPEGVPGESLVGKKLTSER